MLVHVDLGMRQERTLDVKCSNLLVRRIIAAIATAVVSLLLVCIRLHALNAPVSHALPLADINQSAAPEVPHYNFVPIAPPPAWYH